MRAALSRRGLPALAIAFALALALAPRLLAAGWTAADVPLALTAPVSVDWLSWVGSWLRAVWPGAGSGPERGGQHGAGAARPQGGCGSDPNGQNCGNGVGVARPQYGCGSDPSGSPPRMTLTASLRRGNGRR